MRVIGIRRLNFGDLCIVGKFLIIRKKLNHLEMVITKCVSNTNDRIHVSKEHYQKLGREKHVESFENEWKIHVQSRIREYERLSVDITHEHLDRDISALEI